MLKPLLTFSEYDVITNNIRLYHGDCLEVLAKLPDKSVDLVFADPPYNLQLKNELYRPNQTKVDAVNDEWDKFASFKEYDDFSKKWLKECQRILKDTGTLWVIGSYHNIFRVGTIMLDLGYWILNDVQWYKTNPMPNFKGTRFTNATETLIWAKKSEHQKKYTFNHQTMKQLNSGKQMVSVWQIPLCTGTERIKGADGKKAHSTQKPEELLRRVILSSTKEGDIVLDPFLGSGTTGAVARKLNRKIIGIEKELEYINVAKERITNINPENFRHLNIQEPNKTAETRVSVEELLQGKYLKAGDIMFSKNKKIKAELTEDAMLKIEENKASIHRMGAIVQSAEACNGWTYWHIEQDGKLMLIDEIRKKYRDEKALA